MTGQCTIGPIDIDLAQLYDDLDFSVSGEGTFRVVTTPEKAKQIMALATPVERRNYNGLSVLSNKSPWGAVWIDGSSSLSGDDYFVHRGWYLIKNVELSFDTTVSPVMVILELELISRSEHEIFDMNYTTGYGDGTYLNPSYSITEVNYDLTDDFNSFDSSKWNSIRTYGLSSVSSGVSSGKLYITGALTSSAYVQGGGMFQSKQKFTPPFMLQGSIEWDTLPGSNAVWVGIGLSPFNYPDGDSIIRDRNNYFETEFVTSSGGVGFTIATKMNNAKSWTILNQTSGYSTGTKNMGVRIYFEPNGNVTVWRDFGETGTWTQLYSGPSNITDYNNGLYTFLYMHSTYTTSRTVRFGYLYIYNSDYVAVPNIVSLPVTSHLSTSADFTRASSDGNIPCYVSPSTNLRFKADNSEIYKGSVKLYSSNFSDNNYHQILGTDNSLVKNNVYVENGLTRLFIGTGSVEFYAYNGASYTLLNTFQFPSSFTTVKPVYVSPNMVSLQLDDTLWVMRRGDPVVYVKHPDTTLSYTLNTCYYHDGTTYTDPGSGVSITMTSQFYTGVWNRGSGSCASPNPAQDIRLLIVKKDPCSVLSNSLSGDVYTGIGWYSASATGYETAYYRALSSFKQTRVSPNIRQTV